MAAYSISALQSELVSVVGNALVRESATEIDGIGVSLEVAPASAEETAAVLRVANEAGANVVPFGGMTKQGMGQLPDAIDILLSTSRMNGLQYYDPGDLTAGVGAGITVAELQKTLAVNRQFVPMESVNAVRATVGGVLATNSHGPMKNFYGGVRDYCIGVEFATVDGKVVKGGGRVVKNVAGYDLMKLMIGSFGTLGVFTSANFKVFPLASQTRTFLCSFATLPEAMGFRDHLQKAPLTPMCVEVASPRAQEYLAELQAARDPDEYAPKAPVEKNEAWHIYVRAAGSERVIERYRKDLGGAVTAELDAEKESVLWQRLADFEAIIVARHHNAMVMHIDCPLSGVEAAIAAVEQAALDQSCLGAVIGRVQSGALVGAVMPLAVGPPSAMHYANAASAIRAELPKDASARVARCPKEAKVHFDVWGSSPTDISMMKAVRDAVDPKRSLNRGRFMV